MKMVLRGKNIGKPRVLKDKTCICGTTFRPSCSGSKYCSPTCFYNNRKKKGRNKVCAICKNPFYYTQSGELKKFCSQKCFGVSLENNIVFKCKLCKKLFKKPRSSLFHRGKPKYCGMNCLKTARKNKPTIAGMDNQWSRIVKIRGGNKCEYCGKTEGLNSHHLFSRTNMNTRWDVENGICVCVSHHIWGNFSAHKSPIEFIEWLKTKRSEEWYTDLRKRASEIYKPDYLKVKEKLNQEEERL